jgi:hypothetical protein
MSPGRSTVLSADADENLRLEMLHSNPAKNKEETTDSMAVPSFFKGI